jgi:hypothetical protein
MWRPGAVPLYSFHLTDVVDYLKTYPMCVRVRGEGNSMTAKRSLVGGILLTLTLLAACSGMTGGGGAAGSPQNCAYDPIGLDEKLLPSPPIFHRIPAAPICRVCKRMSPSRSKS